jgi:hypothetical protein
MTGYRGIGAQQQSALLGRNGELQIFQTFVALEWLLPFLN